MNALEMPPIPKQEKSEVRSVPETGRKNKEKHSPQEIFDLMKRDTEKLGASVSSLIKTIEGLTVEKIGQGVKETLNPERLKQLKQEVGESMGTKYTHLQKELETFIKNPKGEFFMMAVHLDQHVTPILEYLIRTGLIGPVVEMLVHAKVETLAADLVDDVAPAASGALKHVPVMRHVPELIGAAAGPMIGSAWETLRSLVK